mgnify:CR=1 FL=1
MNDDKLYSFVLRGELTKVALSHSGTVSKHSTSEALAQEYINCLSLDLLDDECVQNAKEMATVCSCSKFLSQILKIVVKNFSEIVPGKQTQKEGFRPLIFFDTFDENNVTHHHRI